jgi:ubiquinone/menaquinone biosynthesis C-methylase UbiE
MSLMEYLPTEVQVPQQGAGKYHGAVATGYDEKRTQDPKWLLEQRIIEDMLDDLHMGDWVLDVPCGTGRFFKFYHDKGFIFRAVDLSVDMLNQASLKVVDPHKARLMQGDVRTLGAPDKCVDAAVMCRLTRWLSPQDCGVALKNLQRIARKKIILTARVANHPHARSIELIESTLDGWEIYRCEVGVDMDYRIIELRPC